MGAGESAAILEANLAALSIRQPDLSEEIRAGVSDPRLRYVQARDGTLVPAVEQQGGTSPLHSLYDPVREAEKLGDFERGAGFCVVMGLGAGLHVGSLLNDPGIFVVLVVEKDASVLRSLLSHVPMQRALEDSRVTLLAGRHAIRRSIASLWQPALMGGLKTLPLRPWCDCERQFFQEAGQDVQAGVADVRADYGVQAHFGKRWLTNILMNLERAQAASAPLPRADQAAVTAAGPSLDLQMQRLSCGRAHGMLIATDTSLPALSASGIVPDAVLSIDCQNYGYHHFLQGVPRGTVLVLDLASPPVLARKNARMAFVAGSHPFVRYLCSEWKHFPWIDMSGGNVAHAAVSLAWTLGASRISLYGADFSYPRGTPYARGTYLFDYFWQDQGRVSPAESRFFSFLFRTAEVTSETINGSIRYTTPVLSGYRDRLENLAQSLDAEIDTIPGDGLAIASKKQGRAAVPRMHSPMREEDARGEWREFLSSYSRDLESLPRIGRATGPEIQRLLPRQKELWNTIMPVAARVVKEGGQAGPAAVEEAQAWTLSRISRILSSRAPSLQE